MVYTSTTHLKPEHQKHLLDEGFTLEQIADWEKLGLRSLDKSDAAQLNLQYWTADGWKCEEGLYFPFTETFGQIRLDIPVVRLNGSTAKYLTPYKANSQAWIPDNCRILTEGAKDAYAGTVHGGIPTGAIAGVSHYRKALDQGAGYTILFDADGWTNPSVLSNLFHAGKWLNGKVQLLPEIEGQPKAGLCEYFKAGHTAEDYKNLLSSAMTPEELLLEWAERFKNIPSKHLSRSVSVALRLAAQYLKKHDCDRLLNILAKRTPYSKKGLERELGSQTAKYRRVKNREVKQRFKEQAKANLFDQKIRRAMEIAEQSVPPSEEELEEIWEFLKNAPNSAEKQVAQQDIREKWGKILFPESKYKQASKAIRRLYGDRLRFNSLKQEIEYGDEKLDLDLVRHEICSALDKDIPQSDLIDILLGLSNKRRYCPIAEYLERVAEKYENDDLELETLADRLFVLKNPTEQNKQLARAYLKRHLIASVARPFSPGCKVDTALILQGAQGIFKSTFFGILYRQDLKWFDDTLSESGDKDELLKLHQHWCVEWAEFERTLGRKGNSQVKSFMTTKVDNFRVPYGRQTKAFPRRGVLVASTNESEPLSDPTGDRRFWILGVKSINLALVRELRDRIWAAAVKLYRAGEQWWLTDQESLWAIDANKPFRLADPWETPVLDYIQRSGITRTTVNHLLKNVIELEVSRQDRGAQMRMAGILKQLGWEKDSQRKVIDGARVNEWVAPDQPDDQPTQPDQPFTEVSQEVGHAQDDGTVNFSGFNDQPDQPFTPTFFEPEPKNNGNNIGGESFHSASEQSLKKGWSGTEMSQTPNNATATLTVHDQPLMTNLVEEEAISPLLALASEEQVHAEIANGQQMLLACEDGEAVATMFEDLATAFIGQYAPEDIVRIKTGIWLGLPQNQRRQIVDIQKSAEKQQPQEAETKLQEKAIAPTPQPQPRRNWQAEALCMKKATPYQQPESPFTVGQRVLYEGSECIVIEPGHTHSQLEGFEDAIANWELEAIE